MVIAVAFLNQQQVNCGKNGFTAYDFYLKNGLSKMLGKAQKSYRTRRR